MGNKQAGKRNHTQLTEEDIEALEANTSFTREQVIEWHASFLKDCPTGSLDRKQFAEVYKKLYPQGKVDKYATSVFNVFDADGNGRIDFNEFLIAITLTSNKDPISKIKLAFKIYDVDRNGRIDKKEMENLIVAIYDLVGEHDRKKEHSPKERVKKIFQNLDVDSSGTITQQEFIAGVSADPELMKMLSPS